MNKRRRPEQSNNTLCRSVKHARDLQVAVVRAVELDHGVPQAHHPSLQRVIHAQHPLRPHKPNLERRRDTLAIHRALPVPPDLRVRIHRHLPRHRPHAVGEVVHPVRRGYVSNLSCFRRFDDDGSVGGGECLRQARSVARRAEAVAAVLEVADAGDDGGCIDFSIAHSEGLDEAVDMLVSP